jgi:hypothetical protein
MYHLTAAHIFVGSDSGRGQKIALAHDCSLPIRLLLAHIFNASGKLPHLMKLKSDPKVELIMSFAALISTILRQS